MFSSAHLFLCLFLLLSLFRVRVKVRVSIRVGVRARVRITVKFRAKEVSVRVRVKLFKVSRGRFAFRAGVRNAIISSMNPIKDGTDVSLSQTRQEDLANQGETRQKDKHKHDT
jgi:hypothetical protein